jgi:phage N-6-adenine-methyltransferase
MKANKEMLAYIGAKPGTKQRDSDSWFTPSYYAELARNVMGRIDLDPFSSSTANEVVKSKRFFDINSDAFKQKWFNNSGTVFMNPPYGRNLIKPSVEIFVKNLQENSISQAVVLVNNATETKWFQLLLKHASSVCFASKRISFDSPDGKNVSGNTRGQVFLYFGTNSKAFESSFKKVGIVLHH